jgi:hypothetical protein
MALRHAGIFGRKYEYRLRVKIACASGHRGRSGRRCLPVSGKKYRIQGRADTLNGISTLPLEEAIRSGGRNLKLCAAEAILAFRLRNQNPVQANQRKDLPHVTGET